MAKVTAGFDNDLTVDVLILDSKSGITSDRLLFFRDNGDGTFTETNQFFDDGSKRGRRLKTSNTNPNASTWWLRPISSSTGWNRITPTAG